jgi:hypothetical protein
VSYVYVITDSDPLEGPDGLLSGVDYVKIGFTSNDVKNRIGQLQVGNPRTIHLVYLYEFENPEMARQIERLCHWKLKGLEISGEWFHYSETVASVLRQLEFLSIFQSYTCPDEAAYAKVVPLG